MSKSYLVIGNDSLSVAVAMGLSYATKKNGAPNFVHFINQDVFEDFTPPINVSLFRYPLDSLHPLQFSRVDDILISISSIESLESIVLRRVNPIPNVLEEVIGIINFLEDVVYVSKKKPRITLISSIYADKVYTNANWARSYLHLAYRTIEEMFIDFTNKVNISSSLCILRVPNVVGRVYCYREIGVGIFNKIVQSHTENCKLVLIGPSSCRRFFVDQRDVVYILKRLIYKLPHSSYTMSIFGRSIIIEDLVSTLGCSNYSRIPLLMADLESPKRPATNVLEELLGAYQFKGIEESFSHAVAM